MTLTVVNPYAGGHYGQALHALLVGWEARTRSGDGGRDRLVFVVGPAVTRQHPDVHALAERLGVPWVETPTDLSTPHDTRARETWMWRTLRTTVRQTRPDRVLLAYLDHFVFSAALGAGVPTSGILFRPSFHYPELGMESGEPATKRWLRREILRLVLHRAHHVFSLDTTAVGPMARLGPPGVPIALPEVFFPDLPGVRPAFLDRVEAGRHIALCIGALDRRKGLGVSLDAAAALPPEAQRRLALVLAGRLDPAERTGLLADIDALAQASEVQVVLEDRYLDEHEIQPTVAAADTVLLPYQKHVGSSGILVRAAAAGRPVIASSDGLVGHHVRQHRLGAAIDAARADALGRALVERLDGAAPGFDPASARAFADGNTALRYADTLLTTLLGA